MSYFYSHIIEIESILVKLDEMDLSDSQKKHLSALIDSTIHQTVLDLILSKLSSADKKSFVEKLEEDQGDKKLMDFLSVKIENIEDEIKTAVKELKTELHEDIKESKKHG